MAKNDGSVTRRVDGFVWLARHARREEIVAYVTGGRDACPDWLKHDRVFVKVQRDRSVWKAAHAGEGGKRASLREISKAVTADGFGVSYEMVANILKVYADGGPERREDQDRLRLKVYARRAITREVVAQFDAQELTAAQVAELIGHGADYRNAAYWIERMREVYAAQDAAASR